MTWSDDDRKRRRKMLRDWLKLPDKNGEGAGPLFRKSYDEIAAALSQEFKRNISKWSARNYVRDIWKTEERKGRLDAGGRPKSPRSDREDSVATDASNQPQCAQPNDTLADRVDSTAPDQVDMRVGAFREVMQLCDISTAELHRLLKNCPGLKSLVGSKSSMHKLLARDDQQTRRAVFPFPRRRDRRSLALSLHQLVVLGPGCLRVILLGCELRTRYINAQIFEVHLPWQDFQVHLRPFQPGIKRMGAPAHNFKDDWQVTISPAAPDDPCPIYATLPRDVIDEFVRDTKGKLPDKVHAIFFNKRVRYDGGFTSAEAFKADNTRVIEAPTSGHQFLPIQAEQTLTTEKFAARVTEAINNHNRTNVYPLWDEYWPGIARWEAYVSSPG